jgi:hypothetical protein
MVEIEEMSNDGEESKDDAEYTSDVDWKELMGSDVIMKVGFVRVSKQLKCSKKTYVERIV